MDHINASINVSPDEVRNGIGDGVTADPVQNFTYLTMILQAFQEKTKEYYRAGSTSTDRSERLKKIRETLMGIKFEGGGKTFTIAPTLITSPEGPMIMSCPPDEKLVNDFCMATASPVTQ
jgi:hypothetical protein